MIGSLHYQGPCMCTDVRAGVLIKQCNSMCKATHSGSERGDCGYAYLNAQLASEEDSVRVITAKCSEVNIVVVPSSQVRALSIRHARLSFLTPNASFS